MKTELGKQIKELRKKRGISTYELEKRGVHPTLSKRIEDGKKGYVIDSLVNYLEVIAPGEFMLKVVEKNSD